MLKPTMNFIMVFLDFERKKSIGVIIMMRVLF